MEVECDLMDKAVEGMVSRTVLRPPVEVVIEKSKPESIFIAESRFRIGNESYFTPELVSIGPYHNHLGQQTLKEMEDVKVEYFNGLCGRFPENDNLMKECFEISYGNADRALKCYSDCDLKKEERRNEFIEKIAVDYGFIIEVLLKYYLDERDTQSGAVKAKAQMLKKDLLLLENQVPFFMLQDFFDATVAPQLIKKDLTLMELAPRLIKKDVTLRRLIKKVTLPRLIKKDVTLAELALVYLSGDKVAGHVLAKPRTTNPPSAFFSILQQMVTDSCFMGLLLAFPLLIWLLVAFSFFIWQCLRRALSLLSIIRGWILNIASPMYTWASGCCCGCICKIKDLIKVWIGGSCPPWSSRIPNAAYLRETGFYFCEAEDRHNLLDITRSGKTIKMPVMCIDETTFSLFKNLFAFEQCCKNQQIANHFTAFATLMDHLIDTVEDVRVLRDCGIIDNRLGTSDQHLVDFFNNLGKDAKLNTDKNSKHYLAHLYEYVEKYYREGYYRIKFYQWRKKLIPDYFDNPWAIPSMTAAFILLVLTMVQTFYTIYPYYNPRLCT